MELTLRSAHGRQWTVAKPLVMAIVNATPDSFSDGGEIYDAESAIAKIGKLVADGADILDVGGESTRPGHAEVPVAEEIKRVVPVIEVIRANYPEIWISIDTSKAEVAKAAIAAGADFVNDVAGLSRPGMAQLVTQSDCSAVIMRHQDLTEDVIPSCSAEIAALVAGAQSNGVRREQIIVDPGLGFGGLPGPLPEPNMALLTKQDWAAGLPSLIGASRKRFVKAIAGQQWQGIQIPEALDAASAYVAGLAIANGAAIVRVHDVAATRQQI